jgi:hypothetical protein
MSTKEESPTLSEIQGKCSTHEAQDLEIAQKSNPSFIEKTHELCSLILEKAKYSLEKIPQIFDQYANSPAIIILKIFIYCVFYFITALRFLIEKLLLRLTITL